MLKRTSITFVFTVMIAIIALLGATGVMAQDLPIECEAGVKYTVTYVAGPVTIPSPTTEWLDYQDLCGSNLEDYPCYLTEWNLGGTTQDLSNMTAVTLWVENDPNDPIVFTGGFPSTKFLNCREARANNWALGICNGITIEIPAQAWVGSTEDPTHVRTYVTTKKPRIGLTSAAIHSGKTGGKVDNCYANGLAPIGGVRGVGYLPSPYVPAETQSQVSLGEGGCVIVKKHPVTECIMSFWTCDDPPQPIPPRAKPDWLGEGIVDIGALENPLCREAMFTKGNSEPYEYWCSYPGGHVCIGLWWPSIPLWQSPCPASW